LGAAPPKCIIIYHLTFESERMIIISAPDILTSTGVRTLLARHGFAPRKKWGQHFLTDEHILQKIISAATPTAQDCVLEVGPGLGALTQGLLAKAGHVIAIELDKGLAELLGITFHEQVKANLLDIVQVDILKADLEGLLAPFKEKRLKVVANLPYYITTPVIMRLLESPLHFDSITVMIQKEVAQRMSAAAGTKAYGSLTLAVQYYAEARIVATVPVSSFHPRPEVESAVIHLQALNAPPVKADKQRMFEIIHAAFAQRRKTLVNALFAAGFAESKNALTAALEKCGLRADIRGEALTIENFAKLTEVLSCRPL